MLKLNMNGGPLLANALMKQRVLPRRGHIRQCDEYEKMMGKIRVRSTFGPDFSNTSALGKPPL